MDITTAGYTTTTTTTSSSSSSSGSPSTTTIIINSANQLNVNKINISNMDTAASNSINSQNNNADNNSNNSNSLCTPKKTFLDPTILRQIRKQLLTPGGGVQSIRIDSPINSKNLNVIKDRYILSSSSTSYASGTAGNSNSSNSNSHSNESSMGANSSSTSSSSGSAIISNGIVNGYIATQSNGSSNITINTVHNQKAKTSYSHLPEISSSNLKCFDIYTEENFLCKIINEPIGKVKLAYFRLMQSDLLQSEMFGHNLIRNVHDVVPLSKNRTYAVIPLDYGYENLHTYVRNKRRLNESEARNIFGQILQTVQVCHASGVILRDLKLKRFFFIDKERTKIQYESLEGSIILDNPEDDTMYEKIGCPLYTAPELLCTDITYLGKPADMWSLGVILYTILVGQYPFNEKNGHNLLTNIRNCNMIMPSPLSVKSKCLIRCLLRKNPKERLIAEDTFFHPWVMQSNSCDWLGPKDDSKNDQCVPIYDGDINMDVDISYAML